MGVPRGFIPFVPRARGNRENQTSLIIYQHGQKVRLIRSRLFLPLQLTFLAHALQGTFFTTVKSLLCVRTTSSMDLKYKLNNRWFDECLKTRHIERFVCYISCMKLYMPGISFRSFDSFQVVEYDQANTVLHSRFVQF